MTNLTIFENSHCNTEYVILWYLDNKSLVNLSGVSPKSRQILSNAVFFKELFERQHRQLSESKIEFKMLCDFHPNNCWKVLCCAFSSGVFKPSDSFVEEALPLISIFYQPQKDELKAEKERLETELKLLWGYPESPLDQAEAAYKQTEQELEIYIGEKTELEKSAQSVYTEQETQDLIMHYLLPNKQELLEMTDEQLKELLMIQSGNDGFLKRELIPGYLSAINFMREFPDDRVAQLTQNRNDLSENLWNIKYKINSLNLRLIHVNHALNLINLHSLNAFETQEPILLHKRILIDEFDFGKSIEFSFIQIPILKECETTIRSILNGTKELSLDIINHMINLITTCPHNNNSYLFGGGYLQAMYTWHTGGSPEVYQWSETQSCNFLKGLLDYVSSDLRYQEERLDKYSPEKSPI